MRVDHSQGDLKTSPSARFLNHPGRDQLSQVGSQMNIITSKHTLLYTYFHRVAIQKVYGDVTAFHRIHVNFLSAELLDVIFFI